MRYYLLLFASILFTATAIDCHAQNTKADTTFHPHWEIGVDLLPLIDKENAPKNSLFARRNYFQKNGIGRAWRMRAGVEVEQRDFIDVGRWTPDTYRTYEPYLSIGHEWQHISKGFRWYYGMEGFGSYYRQKFEYLNFPDISFREGGFNQEYRIGVAGLIGFQLKLANDIFIASESNLSAYYRRYDFESDQLPVGTGGHSEEQEKVFAIGFHPLFVINLIYSIKSKRHENKKT
jgi:hypothetical protein